MSQTNEKENTLREALFSGKMDMEGMDALLGLYRELYPVRQAGPEIALKPRTDDEISMRLGEGFTLLETRGLLPAGLDLTARSRDVAGILAGHSEDPDSVTESVEQFLKEPAGFSELVETYMADGESGLRKKVRSREQVNPEIVMFVVFNSLKGVFLSAVQHFAKIETTEWNHGRCPVCGADPAVSYMAGEGGKRFLVCHRCETNWRFKRLVCPYCEHESPGKSGFLYIEDPEYKMMTGYVCDKCKSYIKTWRVEDEELGSLHPEVEDLKTPGFDAAMEAEGYKRGAPNIFGVLVSEVVPVGTKEARGDR